ncbi:PilT/PilU family type 4a pilus ATPase [Nitrosococcus oceani]|uniref:Pilus retraction protein PilT n=2 Tax=Nitrosococcus oceani TaxID=1229 RepID=Q3JBE1_NITOC|nr:PilT/PilU family type 4a pilus ATPase [Nitrosococcus oceani]KFI19735.1 twitching motility protein PilT [Nitrosococcus oceani C-27]ABA57855.1 Pilus retraction protein PilT [Nitrosococcus oceani ATCC 19707]EDZ68333.1 twitching motility protein [Nitrosococcus oceani AFC27]KFI22851.1 twitching motility protein PilT [Nitrosococcus oceani]GEM19494.1 twitching motility protein PilT [Nitrosococcus oceani]
MEFKDYLKILVAHDGSDIYLSAGAPPCAKFHGLLKPLEKTRLSSSDIKKIAYDIMSEEQTAEFEQKPEMNLALSESGIGRFRVNIFKQRSAISMVIRNIKTTIPNVDNLGLPPILKNVVMDKHGLILFVGATGSGKSTSLAALIDHRNNSSAGHIITIEDPIEYIHQHKRSIVNQREVGVDTESYGDALKNTLRQAPDVILIGEVRDRNTMEHAIAFAETGHLCLSTLHANNANQALDRIINFFPEERRPQLLLDLSLNLRAFISQRLVPTIDGKRTAAIEILLGTPLVRDLIHRGEIHAIKDVMEKSENLGMQTFDSALYKLYATGLISVEEALRNADSPNNLRLKINLSKKAMGSTTASSATEKISLDEKPNKDELGGLSFSLVEEED